jgi:hypothetical protein
MAEQYTLTGIGHAIQKSPLEAPDYFASSALTNPAHQLPIRARLIRRPPLPGSAIIAARKFNWQRR